MLNLAFDGVSVEVAELNAVRRENGHVAIGEEKHVARVAQDRGHVGSDEILALAEADHHGRTFARRDDFIRIPPAQDGEREYAAQILDRGAHRTFQIAFEIFFDQMRDDFGVGLGRESVALALELFLERQKVFDDAVVDDDDIAGAVAVRMGVFFRGAPVRGPAGMADAVIAVDRIETQHVFQVAKFSRRAANAESIVVTVDGEAGGIITAILKAFEAVEDDGNGALRAHVPHDSAHKFIVRNCH